MRLRKLLFAAVVTVAVSTVHTVQADQPRDWMVAAQPGGTYANLDVVFPGAQLQLERRIPIYGQANELDLRASVLPTILFAEAQADVDVRIVVLTLGATVGGRDVFHNLQFASGENFDAAARRNREFGGFYDNQFSAFGEGRAVLSLPLNDHMVLQSINALRYEGVQDRTFDWRLGIVVDRGMLFRSDTTFFLKDRSFGAIGPRVQILNYALDGERNTQVNYGLTFTTRPGLRNRNDILFLSVLLGIGGSINGIPTQKVYGMHDFKIPAQIELAYRTVLEISGPPKPGEDD